MNQSIIKKGDELFLEIRSFPLLKLGGHRYPVSYLEAGQLKPIAIPVGSLDCSSDCYTHTESFKFRDSITIDKSCPICRKKIGMDKLFIDIGFMTFIQKNQTIILNNKYGWANMDRDGRLIGWEEIKNPLIDSMSKYVSKKILQSNAQIQLKNINYLNMKSIIRQKFSSLYGNLKQNNTNRLLTWCRANLRVDESFDGIIINSSAKPDEFNYYKFVDELGSGLTFDGKYTHINFISRQNIFIIIYSNNTRKTIDTFVADLTQGILDNHKMRVIEVQNFTNEFKNWFSTCYDNNQNVLYVVGGEYADKSNKGGVQRFSELKWDGKALSVKREPDNSMYNSFQVGRSLTALTMARRDNDDVLMMFGGLTIKEKTTKYELLTNMLSYTLHNDRMEQKIQGGTFKGKIGAYSNMIQIPKVPGVEKPGILFFAGNSDFRTDIDRHEFCKVYLWTFRGGHQQIQNFKCSNTNYPFLFESTGVLLKTENNRYIVRALIPARNSLNRNLKAYVLEYDIAAKKLTETPINATHIT